MNNKYAIHFAYITIILLIVTSFSLKEERRHEQGQQVSLSADKPEVLLYNKDTKLDLLIIDEIAKAEKFIYFAVYTFTRGPIKDALISAHQRGVKVIGIVDGDQMNGNQSHKKVVDEMKKAGIDVVVDRKSGLMHLKLLVSEKSYIMGSYNFTTAATNTNDEILEIGHAEEKRKAYENIFQKVLNRHR